MTKSRLTAPALPEVSVQPRQRRRFATVRDLVLASIGIAGVLGDEAGALYRRSVERGGSTVQHVRARLPHPHKSRRRSAKPAGKCCGSSQQASDAYEAALARLNLPTTADIDALAQQVAELESQINQLTKKST